MCGAAEQVAKLLLERHLGRLLRGGLDLTCLDVALGSGTLALRDLLLECDYINEQLVPPACTSKAELGFCTLKRVSKHLALSVSILRWLNLEHPCFEGPESPKFRCLDNVILSEANSFERRCGSTCP